MHLATLGTILTLALHIKVNSQGKTRRSQIYWEQKKSIIILKLIMIIKQMLRRLYAHCSYAFTLTTKNGIT